MRHHLILLGFLFICYNSAYAQKSYFKDLDFQSYDSIQGFKIGLTPSALLNKWIGIQGKFSYQYKQVEFEANVGYLIGKNNGESYSGIRIRPLLKYYFAQSGNEFYYFGFGGLYRKVDVDATGTFGRYNNSYYQSLDFKLSQKLKGLYFMFGVLMPLRNDRFFVDVGLGLGNSKMKIEHVDVPEDAQFYTTTPLFAYDTRSTGMINYFIFIGHLSFVYKI